ncbi:MAG: ribosome-associated translation inhibitor RaiA [Patescibacteria group bacterium]
MKINIKTTSISSSQAISDYVDKRLSKISKIIGNDPSIQCDIELAKTSNHHNKGDIFRAEIHIVGAGKNLYAASEKSDLYAAIDDVQDEIRRELKSKKDKDVSLIRRGGAQVKAMMKGVWAWRPGGKKGVDEEVSGDIDM